MLRILVEPLKERIIFGLLQQQRTTVCGCNAPRQGGLAYADGTLNDDIPLVVYLCSPGLPGFIDDRILSCFPDFRYPFPRILSNPAMKLLFDLFPLIIFFAAFKLYDIYIATAAAIIATFIQVGVFWFQHRRFETMHLMTLVVISVFGGLTILLQDDVFIKWKPTIVNWLFAVVIIGMLLFARKSALEYVMGKQIDLPASVWRNLNWAWAWFFVFLGALNLYVAFYYNLAADEETRTAAWVNFKVFWMFGLTMVFAVLQMFYLAKHIKEPEESTEE